MLDEGEDGAAIGQAAVGDAGEFELGAGRDASEIESLECRVGEVETTVKQRI